MFSRYFIGSDLTLYASLAPVVADTPAMEQVDPMLDLGTAMAISGAAVSANMGGSTCDYCRQCSRSSTSALAIGCAIGAMLHVGLALDSSSGTFLAASSKGSICCAKCSIFSMKRAVICY